MNASNRNGTMRDSALAVKPARTEEQVLAALDDKSYRIQKHTTKIFELAHHYYVQNGRGAIVINYKDVDELFVSDVKKVMKYMPLETAVEMDEMETVKLIVTYDPRCEFVLFLSVENSEHGVSTNMYLHVSTRRASPASADTLAPNVVAVRLKRR
jgi:hypothetical protein